MGSKERSQVSLSWNKVSPLGKPADWQQYLDSFDRLIVLGDPVLDRCHPENWSQYKVSGRPNKVVTSA